MRFDRKIFFDSIRSMMPGGFISQQQVAALEFLLGAFEAIGVWNGEIERIAYALATTGHETAWTFEPITERGQVSYFDRYDIKGNPRKAKELGNFNAGDGYRYRGRGYVQITGRDNYRKFGIENDPEAALQAETAFQIMTTGMHVGMFTGRKLSDYINAGKAVDYVNARRIINGTDKASEIAGYARRFEKALKAALVADEGVRVPSEPCRS